MSINKHNGMIVPKFCLKSDTLHDRCAVFYAHVQRTSLNIGRRGKCVCVSYTSPLCLTVPNKVTVCVCAFPNLFVELYKIVSNRLFPILLLEKQLNVWIAFRLDLKKRPLCVMSDVCCSN